jgi:hypothetical protein
VPNYQKPPKTTIKKKLLIAWITGWITYGGFCNTFAFAEALVWQDMDVAETTTVKPDTTIDKQSSQAKQDDKPTIENNTVPIMQASIKPPIQQQNYLSSFADMQKKQMAAFAAMQQEQQTKEQKYGELLLSFKALQKEGQLKDETNLELSTKFESLKKENQDLKNSILQRDNQDKTQLMEIEALKQQLQEKDMEVKKTQTTTNQDVLQEPDYIPNSNVNAIYNYKNGNVYQAYCQEKMLTEIQLQPGEELNFIGGGDTDHWVVQTASSGVGFQKTWHLYIKPLKPDISTDIVITTTKRSYKINVKSANWYTPMISFTYPEENTVIFQQNTLGKPERKFTEKSAT